ncbi:MAG TPA: hypothetical protein VFT12_09275 [Thermoanaerobaculia bacterium]|nr:hypothetical protein [Thermoanaerobaculia bacterium]
MIPKRSAMVFALFLVAGAAAAQDAVPASEFGRVSGGQIEVVTKAATNNLSGSFGITRAGSRDGYGATLGGAVLQDRLWFFAAATTLPGPSIDRSSIDALDAKLTAQLGERSTLGASFSQIRTDGDTALPASFLSLRYTGMPSSSFVFSADFLRQR